MVERIDQTSLSPALKALLKSLFHTEADQRPSIERVAVDEWLGGDGVVEEKALSREIDADGDGLTLF